MAVDEIIEDVWLITLATIVVFSLFIKVLVDVTCEQRGIGAKIRTGLWSGLSFLVDGFVPMFVPVAVLATDVFGAGVALDRLGPVLRISLAVCLLVVAFLAASAFRVGLGSAFGTRRGPFAVRWFGVCASAYVLLHGLLGCVAGLLCAFWYGTILMAHTTVTVNKEDG